MTIKIFYFPSISYWAWVISIALMTFVSNLFIIISSKKQPETCVGNKLLLWSGVINLFFSIGIALMPFMVFYGNDFTEYQIFKSYYLSKELLIHSATLATYGIFFLKFGRKNVDSIDNYLIVAGSSMIIAETLIIISRLIQFLYLLDRLVLTASISIKEDPIWFLFIVLSDLDTTAYTLSLVFFIIHGIKNKDLFIALAFLLIMVRDSITGILYLVFSMIL